jgi:carbamoyltransferase
MKYHEEKNIEKHISELITNDKIVFLYQGRMEFGPRALGNRSIIASPSSIDSKNKLNLKIKKRVWYQPFCPSILDEDAKKIFSDYDYPERFMTMGFMVKEKYQQNMASVINVDGSSRPQIILDKNSRYSGILREMKKKTGLGAVLNTSFNLHGYPIVNTPKDAIEVMKKSKNKYMFMENYLVEL